MDQEIKTKWLAALRSGEYRQAKRVLNDGNGGFCCLGVLCDIYHKETNEDSWSLDTSDDDIACLGYMGETMVIPYAVAKWAKFEDFSRNPRIENVSVAELNDKGKSFVEIADLIEKNL